LLRVPESSFRNAVAAVDSLPQASRTVQVAARVKKKETVSQFANRYGISLTTLMKANPHIRPNIRLAKGQTLMIPVSLGSGQYERLTRDDKTSRKKGRVATSGRKKNRAGRVASRRDRKTRN
jgi:LysM repeat protein